MKSKLVLAVRAHNLEKNNNMTTNISRPFSIDSKIHPSVVAAKEHLTAQHRARAAAAKQSYESRLEQRWQYAEQKRREDWIAQERYNNPPVRLPDPHATLSDAGVVRVVTPAEDRIKVLGEIYTSTQDSSFMVEALRVWLYRRKSQAPLPDVKSFLKEWCEVDGTEEIFEESHGEHFVPGGNAVGHGRRVSHVTRRVIVSGLSPVVAVILSSFTIQQGVVWFAGHVEIVDRPGIRGENITPAHKMVEEFPPNEY
jgi:hypothetical protein